MKVNQINNAVLDDIGACSLSLVLSSGGKSWSSACMRGVGSCEERRGGNKF